MIDTDKYEGTVWDLKGQFRHDEMASEVLLLVAEVKRLRSIVDYIRDTGRMNREREPSGFLLSIMEKVLTTEEYLEWRNEE